MLRYPGDYKNEGLGEGGSAGSPLIKALILNRDVGFVSQGMEVTIKVDSFDFQKYEPPLSQLDVPETLLVHAPGGKGIKRPATGLIVPFAFGFSICFLPFD